LPSLPWRRRGATSVAATAVAVLSRAVLPHLTDTGHGQQTKEKIRIKRLAGKLLDEMLGTE
jgi:hypothetical protein